MQQKKFKIVNTTVKPVRKDPTSGADLRTTTEKVGHAVSFVDQSGGAVMVTQAHPRIVDTLSEGILRLNRGGYIRIESIEDVVTVLKNHVDSTTKKTGADIFSPDSVFTETNSDVAHTSQRVAKAKEMGLDTHAQTGGKEYDGAVNPDGEPNFLVTASAKVKRKERADTAEV